MPVRFGRHRVLPCGVSSCSDFLISHYLRVNAFLWQRSGSRWSAGFKGYGYRPSQSMGKGRRDPAVGFKASVGTRLILLLSLCKQCQITTTYKLIITRYRFLFGTATWEVVQSCSNHSLHGMTYPMTLPTPFPLCQGSEDRPIRLQRYLGSQCQTAFPCDQGAWFSCFDTHPWSPCPKLLWLLRDHDWKIHGSQLVHFWGGARGWGYAVWFVIIGISFVGPSSRSLRRHSAQPSLDTSQMHDWVQQYLSEAFLAAGEEN